MNEKELQEKIFAYRLFESRLDALLKQRDMLINKLMELQSTINSIEDLHKSEGEIIFPIGSGAYKVAKTIDKDNVIVEIGANVALEKTAEEGKATLNKRKSGLENSINQLQQEILKVSNAVNQLGPELQDLAKEFQQQAG
ncbi:MAG: prefoldin subunit alpha [Candidatus Aenigmarchaeota archaeon]|nr:prefoldin subunit alpha [Candidatus Aenigmarchaeota archaeon]